MCDVCAIWIYIETPFTIVPTSWNVGQNRLLRRQESYVRDSQTVHHQAVISVLYTYSNCILFSFIHNFPAKWLLFEKHILFGCCLAFVLSLLLAHRYVPIVRLAFASFGRRVRNVKSILFSEFTWRKWYRIRDIHNTVIVSYCFFFFDKRGGPGTVGWLHAYPISIGLEFSEAL